MGAAGALLVINLSTLATFDVAKLGGGGLAHEPNDGRRDQRRGLVFRRHESKVWERRFTKTEVWPWEMVR